MPRYFFHCADGGREPDKIGTELADDAAAQVEAVSYAGEMLRWNGKELWKHGQWRVEVTNDDGVLLFTVITIAIDAPKPGITRQLEPAND